MRTVYVAVCVVLGGLVGAKLATAERQVETKGQQLTGRTDPRVASGGGILCPLWPIDDYGGGYYMFYAEHFDNLQCLNPVPTIWIGYAPGWPYLCPDCDSASLLSPDTEHSSKPQGFTGLDRKVSASFVPTFPERLKADQGAAISESGLINVTVPGSDSPRLVKLFQVSIDGTARGNRKGVARTFGLGYEVESDQTSTPTRLDLEISVKPMSGSSHTHRLQIGTEEFVLLLAK